MCELDFKPDYFKDMPPYVVANRLFNLNNKESVAYQFPRELLEAYSWSTFDDYKDEIIEVVYIMSIQYGFILKEDALNIGTIKPFIVWELFKENVKKNILTEDDGEELLKR